MKTPLHNGLPPSSNTCPGRTAKNVRSRHANTQLFETRSTGPHISGEPLAPILNRGGDLQRIPSGANRVGTATGFQCDGYGAAFVVEDRGGANWLVSGAADSVVDAPISVMG